MATVATVTFNSSGGKTAAGSRYLREGTINLGSSYTTGGMAVAKALFDLWVDISHLAVAPSAGFVCEWDKTNSKVICYTSAAHTHDVLLKDADQADGATTRVNTATDKLGANTGSSITVHGQAAGASAHGGVLGVAAAALTEVANGTDLSAVNFQFRCEGH